MNEETTNRRLIDLDWRWWWLLAWVGFIVWFLAWKWAGIHWFALPDTDDNMRMSQVRAFLKGQDWFDLRQHRLNPPDGFNMHWSRLVDLPIAGLILAAKPFVGGVMAEKFAVAMAPLLPLGAALYGLMLIARRLIDRNAWIVAIPILASAQATLNMWAPLRIDHHGWQLAFLMWVVAGSADRDRLRGGITTGLASALSLVIGLEMLPYLALAGIMTAMTWVRDDAAAPRLRGYGAALAGGCALGYAIFASNDNRAYVCDALSPVYLSTMLAAGGLGVLLSLLTVRSRAARFGVAALAGGVLAIGFALIWPDCLGRPERISPELETLWFQYINEAKPMWSHGYKRFVPVLAPAVIGTIGCLIALWCNRHEERVMSWATAAALSFAATGLLFWQTRAGAAAQMLGIAGGTWIGWKALSYTLNHRAMLIRVFGTVAGFGLVSGLLIGALVQLVPEKPQSAVRKQVAAANRKCPTMPALAPIARMPATTILTFVDLGPRIITVTHHSALAGPYHRNGNTILDVQHSFRSEDPKVARDVMTRHGATLLLLCPGLSESTIYSTQNPKGFYQQLVKGQVPAWLQPVPLPKGSPFLLWRKVG